MLGAIIGDLAATTYNEDKELFYRQLISDHVPLSEYGYSVLCTAEYLYAPESFPGDFANFIHRRFRVINNEACKLSDNIDRWRDSKSFNGSSVSATGIFLMRVAACAWFGDTINDCMKYADQMRESGIDKEEGYAMHFLTKIIFVLRNGATKDETYQELGKLFKTWRHEWHWHEEEGGLLNYLLRAWHCFYNSFDFGSALHNATKMVGNINLNCALTGAIAEAMYGCDYYLKKAKYAHHYAPYTWITLPNNICERFEKVLEQIRIQRAWVKVFYAKNEAMTNVERHSFIPVENPIADKKISQELRRRILKAFHPGWDSRYGFYLDNGWVYMYRSGVVLGRFRFKQIADDEYRIVYLQDCDGERCAVTGLLEALDTVEYGYTRYCGWHFRYFNPYSDGPKSDDRKYDDIVKDKFLHGERMFYKTFMENHGSWIERGKSAVRRQRDVKKRDWAKRLGPESFGVVIFINELYAKWCPYDNLQWIFEY